MRRRLVWIAIGVILGLMGPAYAPLSKTILLRGLAYVQPGSLEYCSDLGKHIAGLIEKADDWLLKQDGGIKHKSKDVGIDGVGRVFIGDTDVSQRLTSYDGEVIKRRVAGLHVQFRDLEDARLVHQLDLQEKLKIDSKLASSLAGK